MRAVVQRTTGARVLIDSEISGIIGKGLVVFLGIHRHDTREQVKWMTEKIIHLRIFEDENGKMNKSLLEMNGEMLVVSQFTLYGDCRKGRRPGYSDAAPPEIAEPLYEQFIEAVNHRGVTVATGRFQASMRVELANDGPVTLLLDSEKNF